MPPISQNEYKSFPNATGRPLATIFGLLRGYAFIGDSAIPPTVAENVFHESQKTVFRCKYSVELCVAKFMARSLLRSLRNADILSVPRIPNRRLAIVRSCETIQLFASGRLWKHRSGDRALLFHHGASAKVNGKAFVSWTAGLSSLRYRGPHIVSLRRRSAGARRPGYARYLQPPP